MLTPAQRYVNRMAAIQAATSSSPLVSGEYQTMLAQLWDDTKRLSAILSRKARTEAKRLLLSKYNDYIDGVLAADTGSDNDILLTVMVWLCDIGEFTNALKIAEYALKHKLKMPDRYERTVACVIVDEITNSYLSDRENIDINVLQRTAGLAADQDMPDQVRAKLHKVQGIYFKNNQQLALALQQFEEALSLDEKSGVKTDINAIKKLLTE